MCKDKMFDGKIRFSFSSLERNKLHKNFKAAKNKNNVTKSQDKKI